MIGPGSIALIVGAALVIFGPKKLPELGRAAFANSKMQPKA
ncbi:Sec-independent protein translocase protein TatAy [Listeria monocytogenes N53-1]|nr:Sec-independent protein translocase protein TatAy [Listeria monocytogenes]CCQ22812.1 Sec-independent protein translocase protein TatAy [Listeria monocytogenes N53-1]